MPIVRLRAEEGPAEGRACVSAFFVESYRVSELERDVLKTLLRFSQEGL